MTRRVHFDHLHPELEPYDLPVYLDPDAGIYHRRRGVACGTMLRRGGPPWTVTARWASVTCVRCKKLEDADVFDD